MGTENQGEHPARQLTRWVDSAAGIEVRFARPEDRPQLLPLEHLIPPDELDREFGLGEVLVARVGGRLVGLLRFGSFWDEIPIMNHLRVDEAYRGRGIGRRLVLAWEEEMRRLGHRRVMTSTQSDETAQHFYRKLGYRDCGALSFEGEALEVILAKVIERRD
jgi:GNAT superfamily N-acetyltransferase